MLSVKRTYFNKESIELLTFKEFEKLYKGRFGKEVDLKKLFKANGGVMTKK